MLDMGFGHVLVGTPQTIAITGTSAALHAGPVAPTRNSLRTATWNMTFVAWEPAPMSVK